MYVIVYFVHDDLRFLSWFVKFLCSIYTSYTISVLEFSFSKIRIVVEIIFTGTSSTSDCLVFIANENAGTNNLNQGNE